MKKFFFSKTKIIFQRGFSKKNIPKTNPPEDEFYNKYEQKFKIFQNAELKKKSKKSINLNSKNITEDDVLVETKDISEEKNAQKPKIPQDYVKNQEKIQTKNTKPKEDINKKIDDDIFEEYFGKEDSEVSEKKVKKNFENKPKEVKDKYQKEEKFTKKSTKKPKKDDLEDLEIEFDTPISRKEKRSSFQKDKMEEMDIEFDNPVGKKKLKNQKHLLSKSRSPEDRLKAQRQMQAEEKSHDPFEDLEKTKFADKETIKEEKRVRFQTKHIESILDEYHSKEKPLPIDKFVGLYFHKHREINAPRHRHFITNTVYGIVRWRLLIDYFYKQKTYYNDNIWQEKIKIFQQLQDLPIQDIPRSLQVSCPSYLFGILEKDYGLEEATTICLISNQEAPTFGRVNDLKISREKALEELKRKNINVKEGNTPNGLKFAKRYDFNSLEDYKLGHFEVQDESSQISASLLEPREGDLVMDYCCGAGGKSLAFAPKMKNKGQIYLVDIREKSLLEAKKRFARAGVQNINPLLIDHPHLEKLKDKMDWVFVDAPCSGTGTMRRNPDLKYRLDSDRIQFFIDTQREVFDKAIQYLKPRGRIIYSTCSILKRENEKQVKYFVEKYNLKVERTEKGLPEENGKDGFFAVVLKRE